MMTGVREHGFIRVKGFTSVDRGAYTKLNSGLLRHISCLPADIHNKMGVLMSIVHVPICPLEIALQKITINTPIQYGYYETEESKQYKYFGDAINLFRNHLLHNKAFIEANLDVAVASGEETAPGDPVQLNFRMLIDGINRSMQSGQTVHVNLEGMITEW